MYENKGGLHRLKSAVVVLFIGHIYDYTFWGGPISGQADILLMQIDGRCRVNSR